MAAQETREKAARAGTPGSKTDPPLPGARKLLTSESQGAHLHGETRRLEGLAYVWQTQVRNAL